ncbi:MAG: rhodanese-like domain-containing protein [Lentisphaeria bacterium]|nr:rhodanese-like domain-containing protein [Lentisphaeria bacterium]
MSKIVVIFICLVGVLILGARGGGGAKDLKIVDGDKVIDVRTRREFRRGYLKNAINIPYDKIEEEIGDHVQNKEDRIIVYCLSGQRSGVAKRTLEALGYKNVINGGSYRRLKKRESAED